MRRLCGAVIWDESTANRCAVESMPLSAASPASPIASPESAKEPTTNAGSGPQSSTSFVTLVHGSWCSKTSADFFQAEAWVPYSQTFPVSGSMRNGQCYQRERLALRTGGSASLSSAWPTARAENSESCGNHPGATDSLTGITRNWMTPSANDETGKQYTRDGGDPNKPRLSLTGMALVERWPTPDTNPDGRHNMSPGPAGARPTIAIAAKEWATPQSRDGKGVLADGFNEASLPRDASQWPTPNALPASNDLTLTCSGDGREKPNKLGWAIAAWPTPDANADSYRLKGDSQQSKSLEPMSRKFSLQVQATQAGPTSSETSLGSPRRLNPAFAAWLMGWPSWWTNPGVTNSAASEMALYRSRLQRQLSDLCGD